MRAMSLKDQRRSSVHTATSPDVYIGPAAELQGESPSMKNLSEGFILSHLPKLNQTQSSDKWTLTESQP